jgi:hypothetical protein
MIRALLGVAVIAATLSITAAPASADVLKTGNGTFVTVGNGTSVVGRSGELRSYCVQVEEDITELEPEEFAGDVDRALANPRSWIESGRWRFQRIADCADASFRVHLATPDTVDAMCGSAGLDTAGEVSCNYSDRVVINLRRWVQGVPHFNGDLFGYRNMVLNHEVGHELGHDHEFCAGPGHLAPVMQQQTYSLTECEANPYPYPYGLDGMGRWRPSLR